MKELIDKISSYQIFNFLFPGIVFSFLLKEVTHYNIIPKDLVTGVFIYYFVGLCISRVGSVFIEPLLKYISFIKFREYRDYLSASKNYPKLELHSETNNTFRTICSVMFILILANIYEILESKFTFLEDYGTTILIVILFILFIFAYRKQTDYITQQIDKYK